MKKLTRMKLINWHRFVNTTIDFGDATLLSGENGAGKSTILDAIQFVITCSANHFNKAAHENGKRKLTGYIRCKTGKESRPYERTGEISAHIALEFYEESKKRYFIIGAVVDSASEGQEVTARYLIDQAQLSDEMFFQGRTPRNIAGFRAFNKNIRTWAKSPAEAKSMIKTRFGRLEDKFFRLIPKALAFRPIDDIKDFVYSYVLDEKEVNIDVLRENVRTYQDLERTLENVKLRINKLEQIEKFHDEVLEGQRKDVMYAYYLAQAEADLIQEGMDNEQKAIVSESFRLEQEQFRLDAVQKERDEKQDMETTLRVELSQNQDFLALNEQKKRLMEFAEQERRQKEEVQVLKKNVKQAHRQIESLIEEKNTKNTKNIENTKNAEDIKDIRDIKDTEECIQQYQAVMQEILDSRPVDVAKVRALADEVVDAKNRMQQMVQQQMAEIKNQQQGRAAEAQELDKTIARLEKKQLSYGTHVMHLKNELVLEFERLGRRTTPRVLCELLEITDDNWRNAVEGYLNTQRFYILVEPENFDIALGVYDRLRAEKRMYGVGLINAQKLEAYDTAPADSLAAVVTSGNRNAKRFVNLLLGKVKRCDRLEELKQYEVSITRECMRYQNHVASVMKPEIYEVPYIGKNAYMVQLAQAKEKKKKLEGEVRALTVRLNQFQQFLRLLDTKVDMDVKYQVEALERLEQTQADLKKCKDTIKMLEKNATYIQKQLQLDALGELRRELEKEISSCNQRIGSIREKIALKKQSIAAASAQKSQKQAAVAQIASQAENDFLLWKREYEKLTAQRGYQQFYENYSRQRKATETLCRASEDKMKDAMVEYKTAHDFGAAATMQGYPEYAAVYDRLVHSELLKYEEKVQGARAAAEEEFREQFLAKLQENMKQAQTEFKELNKALRDISFSTEQYEFQYRASSQYEKYYNMIMDDFNAMQGVSLFSGAFHENHKEVIDELFMRLALDRENQAQVLDEFTDYRTYMDYDIRILHGDGNYSLYSKVCEEKSGGETQTPFYVTVAASFVQLYNNNIGGEAIGLVLFDEAFNNMDDERIGGVLEFLRRLPLQVIIAAPPDKIQYISPKMQETLLVMTDGKTSYVEEFFHDVL